MGAEDSEDSTRKLWFQHVQTLPYCSEWFVDGYLLAVIGQESYSVCVCLTLWKGVSKGFDSYATKVMGHVHVISCKNGVSKDTPNDVQPLNANLGILKSFFSGRVPHLHHSWW